MPTKLSAQRTGAQARAARDRARARREEGDVAAAPDAKAAAASVAQAVEGVKSVRNDLQVVPPGDRKVVDISDKDITRQIEARFSKTTQLTKIDVRTDGGVVTLTGAGGCGKTRLAAEVGASLAGVKDRPQDREEDRRR